MYLVHPQRIEFIVPTKKLGHSGLYLAALKDIKGTEKLHTLTAKRRYK